MPDHTPTPTWRLWLPVLLTVLAALTFLVGAWIATRPYIIYV